MRDADEHIKKILSAHGEDFETNTWLLPGGKSRAIKHHCTERMAAKMGIWFSLPDIISAAPENVVIIVRGRIEGENEGAEAWSFGEAAPKNNKNAYPYAIAEKRAKGRVALKLLGLHGLLHDETEMDGAAPAVPLKSSRQAKKDGTWPELEASITGCRDSGALLSWAKDVQPELRVFPIAWREQAQETWSKTLAGHLVNECHTAPEVAKWALEYRRQIEALPPEWINTARAVCKEHLEGLKRAAEQREAAE